MAPSTLGLDIGGANLKAAHAPAGVAVSRSFALWKDPAGLGAALAALVAGLPGADEVAVTMTGELCDCWGNKREGVEAILDAVGVVAQNRPVRVWTNRGHFIDALQARADFDRVASANWLATAAFAGRFAPRGAALLIDVGTTTTDVVPLVDGRPVPLGRTDPERIAAGELVYRGWKRTPACALGGLDLAAELFATLRDVFLILGEVAEDSADRDTADGRPATSTAARARLARQFCLDPAACPAAEISGRAGELADRLARQVAGEVARVAARLGGEFAVLAAGSGEFLVPRILGALSRPIAGRFAEVVSLARHWGEAGSSAACALAVAWLCLERGG